MASGEGRLPDSASLAFGTSGFEANFLVESLAFGGINRTAVPLVHLGLTSPGAGKMGNVKKLVSTAVDAGEMTMTIFFDPDVVPPIHSAPEEITVTWPLGAGQSTEPTWVFTGAIIAYTPNPGASGEKMAADVGVTISEDITVTAGS